MFDNLFIKVFSYEAREALFLSHIDKENIKESYRIGILASKYGVDDSVGADRVLNLNQGDILSTRTFGSVNIWAATRWPTREALDHRNIIELGERLDRAFWKFELDYDMARYSFASIAPLLDIEKNPEEAMKVAGIHPTINSYVGDEPRNMRVASGAWAYHYRRLGARMMVAIDHISMVKGGNGQRAIRDALRDGRVTFLIYTSTWMRTVAGGSYTLFHHNMPVLWTATFEAR